MIKTENLSMVFTTEEVQTKALNEVNIEVKQGEFVAIMGPSGCGKSTLLNILGTLDSPTSGKYFFNGKEIDKMGESQLTAFRKGNIGFVFQSFCSYKLAFIIFVLSKDNKCHSMPKRLEKLLL